MEFLFWCLYKEYILQDFLPFARKKKKKEKNKEEEEEEK